MILCLVLLLALSSSRAAAAEVEIFDEDIRRIHDTVPEEALLDMRELGVDGIALQDVSALTIGRVFTYIGGVLSEQLVGPLSALGMMIAAILIAAIFDAYHHSLRYSEMRTVMSVATSAFLVSAVAVPISSLLSDMVVVIRNATGMMKLYLPVMAGMMFFTGRRAEAGGYYATISVASQIVAQIADKVLGPLLHILLAVSVSSGISARVRLQGLCDDIYQFAKWLAVFSMSIYVAVLNISALAAKAGDSVAERAVRLTLSSFIPIIGSSIAEAYRGIKGSIDILRSGLGIFVIIAIAVMFIPLIVRCSLWLVSVRLAKTVSQMLDVSSATVVLSAVGSMLSLLIALTVCVMTVFCVSSATLLSVGGGT